MSLSTFTQQHARGQIEDTDDAASLSAACSRDLCVLCSVTRTVVEGIKFPLYFIRQQC